MYSFHLRPLLPTICVIYRRTTSPHHRLFLPSDLIVAESLVEFLASNGLTVSQCQSSGYTAQKCLLWICATDEQKRTAVLDFGSVERTKKVI